MTVGLVSLRNLSERGNIFESDASVADRYRALIVEKILQIDAKRQSTSNCPAEAKVQVPTTFRDTIVAGIVQCAIVLCDQ